MTNIPLAQPLHVHDESCNSLYRSFLGLLSALVLFYFDDNSVPAATVNVDIKLVTNFKLNGRFSTQKSNNSKRMYIIISVMQYNYDT